MTLHYPFPSIKHIDDVLPHIDDYFRKVEKEGYTYINYNMMMPAVFPPVEGTWDECHAAAIRRECRGITFDSSTGEIVSRPFHKFFNLGEPSAGDNPNPLKHSHTVLEKLDGSMVRPLPNGRWATKMGVTDVALSAEEFVAKNWNYQQFADAWMSAGATPIFEYVGPHNRIVLEYEENMYLLAVRWTKTGQYFSVHETNYSATKFGIPYVSIDKRTLDEVKQADDSEGIVIRYNDGHMLKVKSEWYVKVHRAKELLQSDRRFVESILEGTLDDAFPAFMPEDQEKIKEKLEKFDHQFELTRSDLVNTFTESLKSFGYSKKEFAISSKDWTDPLKKVCRSYVFSQYDRKCESAEQFLFKRLESAVKSNKKFEETMKELGFEL